MFRRISQKKDFNFQMIRRELIADFFQNALKSTAYYLSSSQAVKAEAMRAFIDILNHIVILGANKQSRQSPDENYNYGNLY